MSSRTPYWLATSDFRLHRTTADYKECLVSKGANLLTARHTPCLTNPGALHIVYDTNQRMRRGREEAIDIGGASMHILPSVLLRYMRGRIRSLPSPMLHGVSFGTRSSRGLAVWFLSTKKVRRRPFTFLKCSMLMFLDVINGLYRCQTDRHRMLSMPRPMSGAVHGAGVGSGATTSAVVTSIEALQQDCSSAFAFPLF